MNLNLLEDALAEFIAAAELAFPLIAKDTTRVPLWRRLQSMVAATEPKLQRQFLSIVAEVRNGVTRREIAAALESGGIDAALNVIPWRAFSNGLSGKVLSGLRKLYADAGKATANAVSVKKPREFVIENPRGLSALETRWNDTALDIENTSRDAVRASLADMLANGRSANEAAVLIRPQIGLTENMRASVARLEQRLVADGAPLSMVEAEVADYSARLIRQRALTIARTESQFAAMTGQREGWAQAADDGLFDPQTAQRRWIAVVDSATDEDCIALDGTEVAYGDEFPEGDPPIHPNCRCSVELVTED